MPNPLIKGWIIRIGKSNNKKKECVEEKNSDEEILMIFEYTLPQVIKVSKL